MPPTDADTTASRLQGADTVRDYELALDRRAHAEAATAAAKALPWYRASRRRRALEAAAQEHTASSWHVKSIRGSFGPRGVGAHPSAWGVLSGVPEYHLEATLQTLLWAEDDGLRSPMEHLLEQLPQARLDAHRGDHTGEAQVIRTLRSLADATSDQRRRRSLIEHLPVRDRPQVSALSELERGLPPVTLYVSDNSSNNWALLSESDTDGASITLHDIVVPDSLAGMGLGTAALQELCRYADQVGAQIVGTMFPGPGYEDLETRIPRLAAWYARHGFTAGSRPPEAWTAKTHIKRAPQSPT